MDLPKKTKSSNKKDKPSGDEPPSYQAIYPKATPKPLASSNDSKSKSSTAKESASVSKPRKMPSKAYHEDIKEGRRPRKDKQRAEPDSEDSDSDNDKMSKQIVRRKEKQRAETDAEESDHDSRRRSKQVGRRKEKQRAKSDSDDSDHDYQKKSKQVARRKDKQQAISDSDDSDNEYQKKSKQVARRTDKAVAKRDKRASKKRRDDSDSGSEQEMIVTKTVRKKTLDNLEEMDEGMVDLLCHIFQVFPEKVERWCRGGFIRWDRQTNEYDVEKALDTQDKGEVKRFRKEYAKYKDRWQEPAEKFGASSRRRPALVVQAIPMRGPTYNPIGCHWCDMVGHWCGQFDHVDF